MFIVHPVLDRHLLLANYVTTEVLLLLAWRTSPCAVVQLHHKELYRHLLGKCVK